MWKRYAQLLLILFPALSYGQHNYFCASVSGGPGYYFNNMRQFKEDIAPVNYGFFARVFWNSKYAVMLGLETGYNKYYRVTVNDVQLKASMAAVPFHLLIGMKLSRSFYTNFTFGPALLLNTAAIKNERVNNRVWSYADGSLSVGYRHRLSPRFSVGAEAKFNFSTKAEDMNLVFPVAITYQF